MKQKCNNEPSLLHEPQMQVMLIKHYGIVGYISKALIIDDHSFGYQIAISHLTDGISTISFNYPVKHPDILKHFPRLCCDLI